MRAIVQKVSNASVEVDGEVTASINEGILALVGFHVDDEIQDSEYIINKILNVRIFHDENDVMNLSLLDCQKELLIVSQFTLYGDARKGRRPSYSDAMPPDRARDFYGSFIELCKSKYPHINSGVFGALMQVKIVNSGPVTIMLDSSRSF